MRLTARIVTDVPEIRYARSGEVHIAYQTWGSGPAMVAVPPFVQNIEALWDDVSGGYPRFLRRFGSFATITHFDKRGTGLSDRVPGFVGIEERIDDLRAVMDAVGLERATVGGISEGGPMAMLFAATYPERVESLLLLGTAPRFTQAPDYPGGVPPEQLASIIDALAENWGTADSLLAPVWMPTLAADAVFRRWLPGYERACASPGSVRDLMRFVAEVDVRGALHSIQAPTLIVHRTNDLVIPVALGRDLAERIPNARYVELPGIDHVPWVGDSDSVLDAAEEFLTGELTTRHEPDRVLATVLFTDIVESTQTARRLGDRAWRELLDRHDGVVRRELSRQGGREVKTTGDGFLATFDSPSRGVRAACAIRDAARSIGVEVRAGMHTGEVELRGTDVAGIAVHVGARVAALAGPSEVLVSSTVRDLVLGSEFSFTDRGTHELKGVQGSWPVLAVA